MSSAAVQRCRSAAVQQCWARGQGQGAVCRSRAAPGRISCRHAHQQTSRPPVARRRRGARDPELGRPPAILPRIAPGPFKPSRESLAAWQVPDWFRNAKFGIWAHWGPQSSVEAGDWYARNMYMEGSPQYQASPRDLRASVEGRLQGRDPEVESRALRSVRAHDALQEGRRPLLHEHGGAPRQLRSLELRAYPLERRCHGPAPRRRRRVCGRRAP